MLQVVAAVIQQADGRFLLARRSGDRPYAGYWEFPGGKVEEGESLPEALGRELEEELGIHVRRLHPWITRDYRYPHAHVRLHFFRVVDWVGEPQGREGQELAWQRPENVVVEPMLPANGPILRALRLPPVYGISNAGTVGASAFLRRLDRAVEEGLCLVQLREKAMPYHDRESLGLEILRRLEPVGGTLLVNDDAILAERLGAGLHLSSAQLARLGERPDLPWVAASCHDAAELAKAADLELDFVVLSPVLPTSSHPAAHPLGWEGFTGLAAGYPLPVYALGGLGLEHLPQAWDAGAHGIAAIGSLFAS